MFSCAARGGLSPHQRDAALMDAVASACNIRPQDLPLEAEMPAGRAELNPKFYRPIVGALADGPRRVGDLLQLPEVEGKRDNPAELVGILVGSELGRAGVAPGRSRRPPAAQRFNRVAARRLMQTEPAEPAGRRRQPSPGDGGAGHGARPGGDGPDDGGRGGVDERPCDSSTRRSPLPTRRSCATVLTACIENRLPRLRASGVL